jgi:hypothetical protein
MKASAVWPAPVALTFDLLLAGQRLFMNDGDQLEIPAERLAARAQVRMGPEDCRGGRAHTLHVLTDTRDARLLRCCTALHGAADQRARRCLDLVISADGRIVLALANGLVAIEEPR